MIVTIRMVVAFGMAAVIFAENNFTLSNNVEIEDSFRYLQRQDPTVTSLKNLIHAKLDSFSNKRIQDSTNSSSLKLNSIHSNARLAQMFLRNARMSSASLEMSQMNGVGDSPDHHENAEEARRISKRRACLYRSCCDCCRTRNVNIQLPTIAPDLIQILSLGRCPDDVNSSRGCSGCHCTEELRTFWELREIQSENQPPNQPTLSRLSFVPVEHPGRCVHANHG